jgi:predicted enzyme related to lactoylglutathione lyase
MFVVAPTRTRRVDEVRVFFGLRSLAHGRRISKFKLEGETKMAGQPVPVHGAFCWNELATNDASGAKKFYTELLGWQLKEGDAAPGAYTEIVVGTQHVGGIYQMGSEFGSMPPHWIAYVAVDDVDAAAKRVEELGGKVRVPPRDIPDVGRFCVITDPAGAALSLITLKGAGV